jgi:hypothetical protein
MAACAVAAESPRSHPSPATGYPSPARGFGAAAGGPWSCRRTVPPSSQRNRGGMSRFPQSVTGGSARTRPGRRVAEPLGRGTQDAQPFRLVASPRRATLRSPQKKRSFSQPVSQYSENRIAHPLSVPHAKPRRTSYFSAWQILGSIRRSTPATRKNAASVTSPAASTTTSK